MSVVPPFHSDEQGTEVYHNDDKCALGDNIEKYNLVAGTGNLRLCNQCAGMH